MMSVSMELIPENFEREYLAVICPVAKRRIVVSYFVSIFLCTCIHYFVFHPGSINQMEWSMIPAYLALHACFSFSNLDSIEGLTLQKSGFNVACLFCFVYTYIITWNGLTFKRRVLKCDLFVRQLMRQFDHKQIYISKVWTVFAVNCVEENFTCVTLYCWWDVKMTSQKSRARSRMLNNAVICLPHCHLKSVVCDEEVTRLAKTMMKSK